MDEDTIIIQIEIRQMVQAVKTLKQVAAQVKDLNKGATDQAKAAKHVTDEIKKQNTELKKQQSLEQKAAQQATRAEAQKDKALARQFNAQGRMLARQRAAESRADAVMARRIARDNSAMARQAQVSGGGNTSSGPASRLQNAYTNYQNAMKFGTGTQVFDAQAQLAAAQQAHARAQKAIAGGGGGGGRRSAQGMGMRGRLGLSGSSGGLRPRFSLFEFGLNPFVIALGIAAVAVAEMAKSAIEAGVAFAKLGLTAGGTQGQTAQLSVLGNAFGVDMGQMARQFAETISHGGTAGGFAARAGIHDYGTFDTTNKAQKLLAWLDRLRSLSPTEAMRQARATGTEGLLPYRMLSQETMGNLRGDAAIKEQIMGGTFGRDAAEASVALARFGDSFSNLVASVFKPLLPQITVFFTDLANAINQSALAMNSSGNQIKGFFEMLSGLMKMIATGGTEGSAEFKKGFEDYGKPNDVNKAEEERRRATEENTDALNANTYAQRNGTYGGGERARGAVPGKWSGMNTERFISEASRLGAFAF